MYGPAFKFVAVKGSSVSIQLAWLPGSGVQSLARGQCWVGQRDCSRAWLPREASLALGSPHIIQRSTFLHKSCATSLPEPGMIWVWFCLYRNTSKDPGLVWHGSSFNLFKSNVLGWPHIEVNLLITDLALPSLAPQHPSVLARRLTTSFLQQPRQPHGGSTTEPNGPCCLSHTHSRGRGGF